MIAIPHQMQTTSKAETPRTASRLSDAIIGAYFALFPALVAMFLMVQAVRAQMSDVDVATAPITMSTAALTQ